MTTILWQSAFPEIFFPEGALGLRAVLVVAAEVGDEIDYVQSVGVTDFFFVCGYLKILSRKWH